MYHGTTPGFKPQCGQTFFFSSSSLFLNFKIKSTMYHGTTPGFKPRVALFFFSFSFLFLQHLKYQSTCTTVRLLQYRVNLEDIHTYPLLYMKINSKSIHTYPLLCHPFIPTHHHFRTLFLSREHMYMYNHTCTSVIPTMLPIILIA